MFYRRAGWSLYFYSDCPLNRSCPPISLDPQNSFTAEMRAILEAIRTSHFPLKIIGDCLGAINRFRSILDGDYSVSDEESDLTIVNHAIRISIDSNTPHLQEWISGHLDECVNHAKKRNT